MTQNKSQPRFHLALDMDDTLCSFIGPVIHRAKELFGIQYKLPPYGKYSSWFRDSFEEHHQKEILKSVFTPEFYLGLPSSFSPAHTTHSLASVSATAWDLYKSISVVTARKEALGKNAESVTREWLRKHDFHRVDEVTIHIVSTCENKANYLSAESVLVDDSIHVVNSALASDHRAVLLSQPWNIGFPRRHDCIIAPIGRLNDALVRSAQ